MVGSARLWREGICDKGMEALQKSSFEQHQGSVGGAAATCRSHSWLLRDAMRRTLAAAETIGVRAMLVHALHEHAAAFYVPHGLEPSPTEPRLLMILIKDIAAALNAGNTEPEALRYPAPRTTRLLE